YIRRASSLTDQQIRTSLEGALPEYMIPNYFVQMESFPLTPSGKIDRKALPKPEDIVLESEKLVAPRSELEKQIYSIWLEVLGIEQVGIFDNFFHVGGHSLRAIQVVSRIEDALEVQISLGEFFSNPTIEKLAKLISS